MTRQPNEKRAGQSLAAGDTGPFLARQIRSDEGRAAFMTLAEDLKEELRTGRGGTYNYFVRIEDRPEIATVFVDGT